VRNGVIGAPRFADSPQPPGARVHRPSVVTVSGMYERKGMHDLIRAFAELSARVPQAHLYLVGDGPDRFDLEELSLKLGVSDKTHFVGYVADPRSYLEQADVFVLPSHNETSSLALMEAREIGCAIVATMVGGIPETLDQGAAGVMVPPSDPARLSNAIFELLINEHERQLWKERAKTNLQGITASRVHEEYLQIYMTALNYRGLALSARKTQETPTLPIGEKKPVSGLAERK
jgi:glycosyltransferase involved in cell wall biosynthesis